MLILTCRKGIRFAKRMRKGHLGSMAFKGDKGEQNGALRLEARWTSLTLHEWLNIYAG
jgi:hypothetical protein